MIAVIVSIIVFAVYTIVVKFVDVGMIGPNGSEVGLAGINRWFHALTGVNMGLYNVTDWASVIPFAVMAVFAIMGLVQLIRRKNLFKVDADILALGIFYVLVFGAYALFEVVKINYRPVLIERVLETSYPSSTTMLAITVCVSAMMLIPQYLYGKWGKMAMGMMGLVLGFLVVGRLLSGVHWLTDIIGGILLSTVLILTFAWLRKIIQDKLDKKRIRLL